MIVTVNKERKIYYHGAMAVTGDRITEVGETKELEEKCKDAKEVIDLDGKIIFPGFINTHNHLFQTLLKWFLEMTWYSVTGLQQWTFPAAQYLEPEDCYYGAMLGCMEGIRSGMTTQVDYMYPHAREGLSDGVIKAYKELKIRGIFGRGCMDEGLKFWCMSGNHTAA
mgnify:CR=1 FL=1